MNGEEDIGEIIDDAEDQYEDSQEVTEEQLEQYDEGFSTGKKKDDAFSFFFKVLRLMDPYRLIRVGNLDKAEIGEHGISIRDSMNLANLGKIFHHKKFGDYWQQRAIINTASSMSRKGWFMETTISQKKVRQRERSSTSTPFEKSRIFGKKRQQNKDQPGQ